VDGSRLDEAEPFTDRRVDPVGGDDEVGRESKRTLPPGSADAMPELKRSSTPSAAARAASAETRAKREARMLRALNRVEETTSSRALRSSEPAKRFASRVAAS
jgi:hypothetical protein